MLNNGILDRLRHNQLIHCSNIGITLEDHQTKMVNLGKQMKSGHLVMTPISHDVYSFPTVPGKLYNPYTDKWHTNKIISRE